MFDQQDSTSDSGFVLVSDRVITGGGKTFGANRFSGLRIEGCRFENCRFGLNGLLRREFDCASDVIVRSCTVNRCTVGPGEIRRVHISDISGDMLICWGARFDSVTLSGRIEKVMLQGIPSGLADSRERALCKALSEAFYADVNWALDISAAEFGDFSIRNAAVPMSLLRLDRNSQFIVRVSVESLPEMLALPISKVTANTLRLLVDEGCSEGIIVAPKLNRKQYSEVLRDADALSRHDFLKL